MIIVAAATAAASWSAGSPPRAEAIEVRMPKLSTVAQVGQWSFFNNCAQYHGVEANGTDKGPLLIHKIYEPNHHGDTAFLLAIAGGTRQHHWNFGDMVPQPKVRRMKVEAIIKFVREVQRANGIE